MTAPTFTEIDLSNSQAVNSTTYDTGSVTPTANRLIVISVVARSLTTAITNFTASGNGLTWVEISFKTEGSRHISVLRSMGSSPSAGVITLTADQDIRAIIVEVSEGDGNEDTSGSNGSGAIVQVATEQSAAALATGGTLTCTLTSFASGNTAFALSGGDNDITSLAFGTDTYTELEDSENNQVHIAVAYFAGSPASDQVVSTFTNSANARCLATAIEIKAAAGAGAVPHNPLGHPLIGAFGGPV